MYANDICDTINKLINNGVEFQEPIYEYNIDKNYEDHRVISTIKCFKYCLNNHKLVEEFSTS